MAFEGTQTTTLTLNLQAGNVTLAPAQSLMDVEVGTGASLSLAGNVTLNGPTVNGSATHASGTLAAAPLNIDSTYTDAGGVTAAATAADLTLNNTGTFTAAYTGSLASTPGTFDDAGTFVENVPAGGVNTLSMTLVNQNMSFNLLSGALKVTNDIDCYDSLNVAQVVVVATSQKRGRSRMAFS